MIAKRTRVVVLIGASLYASAMAFAGGVAAERIRFDRQRAVVLQRYDEAAREWHQVLMAAEYQAEHQKAEGRSAAGDAVQVVR